MEKDLLLRTIHSVLPLGSPGDQKTFPNAEDKLETHTIKKKHNSEGLQGEFGRWRGFSSALCSRGNRAHYAKFPNKGLGSILVELVSSLSAQKCKT